jgi:hypothetical protein
MHLGPCTARCVPGFDDGQLGQGHSLYCGLAGMQGTFTCQQAPCPSHAYLYSPITHAARCNCVAGSSGSISFTTTPPFTSGACTPVACPANSFGGDVVSGCSCDVGYEGNISGTETDPYYGGVCDLIQCSSVPTPFSNFKDSFVVNFYGESTFFECDSGFNGSGSVTCGDCVRVIRVIFFF